MPIAVFAPELAAALLAGSQIINGINSLTDAINEKHNVLDTDGIPELNVFMNDTAGPCGVPRYNFDLCHSELQGITVTASKPVTGRLRPQRANSTIFPLHAWSSPVPSPGTVARKDPVLLLVA
ncbi:hypothetical protein MGN70_014453 [Eutypa lata]|nr:hypothetical protein MGN70_014453 [Eutypa lata]